MNELNWKKIKFLRYRIAAWIYIAFASVIMPAAILFSWNNGDSKHAKLNALSGSFIIIIGGLILLVSEARHQLKIVKAQQAWLIDVVNWNAESLENHNHDAIHEPLKHEDNAENSEAVEAFSPLKEDAKVSEKPPHWPWGSHHTETLGHLEAAARRFWRLYDPSDISTAPTNDMVATWLQEERGISREKARAIASMLRPDGLPTGPRR